MPKISYSEKLKDPRWQRRRLEILQRDEFTCNICGDGTKTLHVHHKWYESGKEPWEHPDNCLTTLCVVCHEEEAEYKCNQELLVNSLLRSGFYNFDLYPFSYYMEKAIELIGRYEFEYLIKQLMTTEEFRNNVLEHLDKTRKQSKIEVAGDDPF